MLDCLGEPLKRKKISKENAVRDTYLKLNNDRPINLENKIILITGVSQGIGRALALHAAQAGATLILMGRKVKALETLYDEIVAKKLPEPAIQPVHLMQLTPQGATELADSIQKMFGRLDGLVHNASTVGQICPIANLPPHQWQEAIHVNLNIPYLLTHALLPLLNHQHPSHILFTLANEATAPKAYWGAYSASKMGLLGLATTLHQELQANTNILVNCVNPGMVRTAMRLNAYPGINPDDFPTPEQLIPYYLQILSQNKSGQVFHLGSSSRLSVNSCH